MSLEFEIGVEDELADAERALGRNGGQGLLLGLLRPIGHARHELQGMAAGEKPDESANEEARKRHTSSAAACASLFHLRQLPLASGSASRERKGRILFRCGRRSQ